MILLQNIEKQYGAKVLYRDVNLTLHTGKRYGLIGHNGAGKSVLLRILSGEELPDSGSVNISPAFKVAYLAQEAETPMNCSPMEIVLSPFKHLFEADSAFAELASIEDHRSLEYANASQKVHELQQEIERFDIYSLESRASTIMAGLGIVQEKWHEPVTQLSGGFRMRVVLAQLLLQDPDFLIMDEPTNHLDMDSLVWLERFLLRFRGGMLIVSHDRDFMNRVVTHTLEIAGQKISDHVGNLEAYFLWKAECEEHEAKRLKNLNEKIEKNERFVERFKAKATKATQAKSRMKYLDKLYEERPEESIVRRSLDFVIPPSTPCGSVPFRLEKVTAGYEENVVLKNVSLTVNKGDKVAIIGPNGAGKSTLMKVLANRLDPFSGELLIGHNADVRYFSQHRLDDLDGSRTLYDTIADQLGENRPTEIRKLLGTFLFSGDEVLKTVDVLSGGEKSRLSLLMMLVKPGNTLLLDEPTNHLDLDSIETVADALAEYDGTVIVVSHDEFFISSMADRIIEVRPGMVRDFPGNLDDYRWYLEQGVFSNGSDDSAKVEIKKEETVKQDRMDQREAKKKISRQLEKIERTIAETESKIETKVAVLHDEANAQNFDLLVSTQKEIDELNAVLESQMEEWENIQVALEELG